MKPLDPVESPGLTSTAESRLETLLTFAARIADEHRLPQLLALIQDMARAVVQAERASIWLVDREYDELYTVAADQSVPLRMPFGSGVVGAAINTEEPVLIVDASKDPRFNAEFDQRTGFETRSIIAFPFRNSEGDVMGAFQVVNKTTPPHIFTEQDSRTLGFAAAYAGKALESAILYQELEQTQATLLLKLGEVAESRSKDTGLHVQRVAEYCHILALEAGFSSEDASLLRMVAPMHDVGKVAVPDSILNKPGKLSAEDFEIMKSHTEVGYSIFRGAHGRVLAAAAIVAWQHHEKWNGGGYPRGLAGHDIHPFARITAVADVFDALASERVYKRAWEIEKVIKLFEDERGKHFEPRLVDALKASLPKILEVRERLKDPPMPVSQ